TVSYPNAQFEIRENDQPVKYILNGGVRVARIVGSLSSNATRVQRLRLFPGWNLCSIAVEGAKLPPTPVTTGYKWNSSGSNWVSVSTNDSLAGATVLWLHSAAGATLTLTGTYTEPGNQAVPSGRSFQPGTGLEALLLPDPGSNLALWHYDARSQT